MIIFISVSAGVHDYKFLKLFKYTRNVKVQEIDKNNRISLVRKKLKNWTAAAR